MDRPGIGVAGVKILFEVMFFLFLNHATAGDQRPLIGKLPVDLPIQRERISLELGIHAQVKRRPPVKGNAVKRELQPIVRVGVDVQVIETGDPGRIVRRAVEPEFLRQVVGIDTGIVDRLIDRPRVNVEIQQLFVILEIRDRCQRNAVRKVPLDAQCQAKGLSATHILEREVAGERPVFAVRVQVAKEITARRDGKLIVESELVDDTKGAEEIRRAVIIRIRPAILAVVDAAGGADAEPAFVRCDINHVEQFALRKHASKVPHLKVDRRGIEAGEGAIVNGDRRLGLIRATAHIGIFPVGGHRDAQRIPGVELQDAAQRGGLAIAEVGTGIRGRGIGRKTVVTDEGACPEPFRRTRVTRRVIPVKIIQVWLPVVIKDRDASSHGVGKRSADGCLQLEATGVIRGVVDAVGHIDIGFRPVKTRLAAEVLNDTAGCIPAEQGALGALQYFDPLDVINRKGIRLRDRDIAFIEIDGDGRFDDVVKVVLRDAANRELAILTTQVAADIDVRYPGRDVEAVIDPQGSHLLAAECGDRNTHVLNILLTFLSRDDDFLQHSLCDHRKCHAEKQHTNHIGRYTPVRSIHDFPPNRNTKIQMPSNNCHDN